MKRTIITYKFTAVLVLIIFTMGVINTKSFQIHQLQKENIHLNGLIKSQQMKMSEVNKKISPLFKKRILTSKDIDALERIVEAEAGNQGVRGKSLVANVVLNRWSKSKGRSVHSIITEPGQFQPVANGTYYSAIPTEETKRAVEIALWKDYSHGSDAFRNPKISNRSTDTWFNKLRKTVRHKNHQFYKSN